MLVLSRQAKQRIRFPGLGIAIEILDIRKSKVRVGIDAPLEVRVLRDELEDLGETLDSDQPSSSEPPVVRLPQEARHELRNTLHELSLMLHVCRQRALKEGIGEDHQRQMLEKIIERLSDLDRHDAFSTEGIVDAATESRSGPKGKALVVDDNDNERELMAGFLRMCGYEVVVAADGVEAMRLLRETDSLRVVLLDMSMPGGGGREFLDRVRGVDLRDPVSVFVVSGYSEAELGLSPEAGYTHWFQKPLDPRAVVGKLDQLGAGLGDSRVAG